MNNNVHVWAELLTKEEWEALDEMLDHATDFIVNESQERLHDRIEEKVRQLKPRG